jgi:hypothetical protein
LTNARQLNEHVNTRTLVIIFAPLTLVHVMVAIYASVSNSIIIVSLSDIVIARVFWSPPRTMANIWKTCTHPARGFLYLCMVCSFFAVFRQFLHLACPLCVRKQYRLVRPTPTTRATTSGPWTICRRCGRYDLQLSTCIDLSGRGWPCPVLHQSCHQPLQDLRESQVVC